MYLHDPRVSRSTEGKIDPSEVRNIRQRKNSLLIRRTESCRNALKSRCMPTTFVVKHLVIRFYYASNAGGQHSIYSLRQIVKLSRKAVDLQSHDIGQWFSLHCIDRCICHCLSITLLVRRKDSFTYISKESKSIINVCGGSNSKIYYLMNHPFV